MKQTLASEKISPVDLKKLSDAVKNKNINLLNTLKTKRNN